MDEGMMGKFFSARSAQREVEQIIKKWMTVREAEESRRKSISEFSRVVVHKWTTSGPHSKEDNEIVLALVHSEVSVLNEASTLGEENNNDLARCVESFKQARRMSGDEKLVANAKLIEEATHVLNVVLPKRSSILDNYEREVNKLNDFISHRLGSSN
jgi:hypothetical protein